jgi:hypothetical protein
MRTMLVLLLGLLAALILTGCATGAKVDISTLILGAKEQGRLQAEFETLCAVPPKISKSACDSLSRVSKMFDALVLEAAQAKGLDVDKLFSILIGLGSKAAGL